MPWATRPHCPCPHGPCTFPVPISMIPEPSLSPQLLDPPRPRPHSPSLTPQPLLPPHLPESPTVRAMEGEAPGSGGAGGHLPAVGQGGDTTPQGGCPHLGSPAPGTPQFGGYPSSPPLPILTWQRGRRGRQGGWRGRRGGRSLRGRQDGDPRGLIQSLGLGLGRGLDAQHGGGLGAVAPPESLVLLLDHPPQRVHLVARVLVGLLGRGAGGDTTTSVGVREEGEKIGTLPPFFPRPTHLDRLQLLLPLQQLLLQLRHPHHVLVLQVQQLLRQLPGGDTQPWTKGSPPWPPPTPPRGHKSRALRGTPCG